MYEVFKSIYYYYYDNNDEDDATPSFSQPFCLAFCVVTIFCNKTIIVLVHQEITISKYFGKDPFYISA